MSALKLLLASLLFITSFSRVASASAMSNPPIDTIVISGDPEAGTTGPSSRLVITLAASLTSAAATSVAEQLTSRAGTRLNATAEPVVSGHSLTLHIPMVESRNLTGGPRVRVDSKVAALARLSASPGQGPNNAVILCNRLYIFTDSDGQYSVQRSCTGSTAPWGYVLAASLRGIITGTVHEAGMNWTRNGVKQGIQAPHNEAADYTFHGSYNPVAANVAISYSDVFTFRVNVGGNTGSGTLRIFGSMTFSGAASCATGKPC